MISQDVPPYTVVIIYAYSILNELIHVLIIP